MPATTSTWIATQNSWGVGELITHTDFNNYLGVDLDIANRFHVTLISTGEPSTGFMAGRLLVPNAYTVVDVRMTLDTASTSGNVVADILKSTDPNVTTTSTKFATLFTSSSRLPTVLVNKTYSTSGATTPNVTSIGEQDVLVGRVVSEGSTAVRVISLSIGLEGA